MFHTCQFGGLFVFHVVVVTGAAAAARLSFVFVYILTFLIVAVNFQGLDGDRGYPGYPVGGCCPF